MNPNKPNTYEMETVHCVCWEISFCIYERPLATIEQEFEFESSGFEMVFQELTYIIWIL